MPSPGAGVRNRKPAGLRNPRRGGLLGAQTELFTWRFRECALPGVEVAQAFSARRRGPRAPVPRFSRYGHFVRGGGRRAEPGLRTSRQEKPAARRPQKRACGRSRKKEKGPFRRAPSRLKLQQRAKKRQRASPCGGGRRAEPGLRTSRHLCPEGVKKARGPFMPRRGTGRNKRERTRLIQKDCLLSIT